MIVTKYLRRAEMTFAFFLGPSLCSSARAQETDSPNQMGTDRGAIEQSAATEVTRVAYAHTAFGASSVTMGGAGFGEARGEFQRGTPHLGGGVRVWGSPVDRLTLLADGERRDTTDEFAPSASVQVRILGGRPQGWALAGLARYKAEGFAELGGEAEFGVLGSYGWYHAHLDVNVIVGTAFEESESDAEGLVRGGYDVLAFLRVGGEGRLRYRIAGDVTLPGGRSWDAIVGPQLLGHYEAFFGALTGGPSTVGIVSKVGWAVIATAGGVAF